MDNDNKERLNEETTPSPSTSSESPLTTSNESESFDTWTIVVDAKSNETDKPNFEPLTPEKSDDEDKPHIDLLEVPDIRFHDNDHSSDELSDGISIISESENADRSSPHSHITDHDDHDVLPMPKNLRESCSQTIRTDRHDRAVDTINPERVGLIENVSPNYEVAIDEPFRFTPVIRRSLPIIFKIIAALAMLAFIGKLRYPEWQPLSLQTEISPLRERIDVLELQNNLLRAEIDILTKQMNYMNSQGINGRYGRNVEPEKNENDKPKFNNGNGKPKRPETIKVWSGKGNNPKQVEIPKKDLKTPYKCELDEEDIGGFCVKDDKLDDIPLKKEKESAGSFLNEPDDDFKNILDSINNHFAEAEDIDRSNSNPDDGLKDEYRQKEQTKRVKDYPKEKNGKYEKDNTERKEFRKSKKHSYDNDNSGERFRKSNNNRKFKDGHSGEEYTKSDENKKYNQKIGRNNDDHSGERQKYKDNDSGKKYAKSDEFKKYDKKKGRDNDNSGEKHEFNKYDHSGERYTQTNYRPSGDHSGEKHDYKKFDKKTGHGGDGDWHEKLMQNREDFRKYNEKEKKNNWYIERRNGREEARIVDSREKLRRR